MGKENALMFLVYEKWATNVYQGGIYAFYDFYSIYKKKRLDLFINVLR